MFPQEELYYAHREIFRERELKILQIILWPILGKDFIAIRLEWYYIKPQEVFIKESFLFKGF